MYARVPHQDLVQELLAPVTVGQDDGHALLTKRLAIARELLLRDLIRKMKAGPLLNSPDAVHEWLRLYYLDVERETFLALFLDTRHRLIDASELFRGTINTADVHPREVVREALRHNAVCVCVAHNHPSGNTEPSAPDCHLTQRLKRALALVDIRLLDHFIVAGHTITSMAVRGLV